MSNVLQRLDEFLDRQYVPGKPVLLGFSGGPDSSALLHAFWQLKQKYSLELIVVHIDHRWREESGAEALLLKGRVEALGFSFILETLSPLANQVNLEEEAREARIGVFQKVYFAKGAQALALAHQAQDQSETVLKRLFEGSHITASGAMTKVSTLEELTVWRPLLEIPKEELVDYCRQSQVDFLLDKTNEDPRFLRARMRKSLIPLLEEHFGKKIQGNLARFSKSAHEIAEYFASKTDALLKAEEDGAYDFRGVHPLEAKMALLKLTKNQSLRLGQRHIDHLLDLLRIGDGEVRKFSVGANTFLIKNEKIYIE